MDKLYSPISAVTFGPLIYFPRYYTNLNILFWSKKKFKFVVHHKHSKENMGFLIYGRHNVKHL